MKKINDRDYLSDKGMVFKHKESGVIYGWGISLGTNNSIENYEEVECPEQYKNNKDYDNTVGEKVDEHLMKNELGKIIDGTDDVIENYEEVEDPEPKEE